MDLLPKKTGNEKRIESCKKIGGAKKRKGHKREDDFKKQYNLESLKDNTEYGPTSDTSIAKNHPILVKIKNKLYFESNTNYCSNKSGNNLQFVLGNIPELDRSDNLEWIQNKDNSRSMFNKYLKKSESDKPADYLVYKDKLNKKWIFMLMDDIIDHIANKCKWRKLSSGRLKGDFDDDSYKGFSQYLTYEYRATHNSHFLGANGGCGIKFIKLLKNNIKYIEDDFNY